MKARRIGVGIVCAALAALSAEGAVRKHLIYHGWDLLWARTEDVWRNREKFAATGVDGIAFPVDGKTPSGKDIRGRDIMTGVGWTDEAFAKTVRQLSDSTRCRGLGESLALSFWSPGVRLGWSDDAAWNRFAANAEVLARTVRAGGLKGILIDQEDYNATRQFRRMPGDAPYDELYVRARARGRQVFSAMLKGFPNARFLAFWFFSSPHKDLRSPDVAAVNEANGDLWPAFLNGALDVLPETARFIDGCETTGYLGDVRKDGFRAASWEPARGALPLVAPENRAKYAQVLSVSFGQYLDMYVNEPGKKKPGGWEWYFGPLGGSRLSRFADNLTGAFAVADDCIWAYGERHTLIDWAPKDREMFKHTTWESRMPGIAQVFRAAVGDFSWYAREAKAGHFENLVANAGCDSVDGKVPVPFRTYTEEKNPASDMFTWDGTSGAAKKGSLLLRGKGMFIFGSDGTVRPGDRLYVSVAVRGRRPLVNVVWRTKGMWNWDYDCCYLAPPKGSKGWRRVETLRVVPEGVDGIGFTMGGDALDEAVAFDDIGIYRVTKSGQEGER